MKHIIGVTFTAIGLLLSPNGFTESASSDFHPQPPLPFPLLTGPLQQQCWLDHTQLQPVPSPGGRIAAESLADGGSRVWNPPGSRPGSEHWNVADLQRACRSQWSRRASMSGTQTDFLSKP